MALNDAPDITARTRLLVVAPHPDDETLANAVLIQHVLAVGGAVRVLLLTDGDNNPWPQRWLERRWRIDAAARARWGSRRRAEFESAMRWLGVPVASLQPLAWPDLGLLDCLLQPGLAAVGELAAVLADFTPTLLAMPALDDSHPDHGAAHVSMRLALARCAGAPTVLTYRIHGAATGAGEIAYPVTPAEQACKRQAMAMYQSQLALSRGRLERAAAHVERYQALHPTTGGVVRCLPWRPVPWWRSHLHLIAATERGDVQRWRWPDAPLRDGGQGGWRLDWPEVGGGEACFVRLSLDWPSPWIFDHWGWREI